MRIKFIPPLALFFMCNLVAAASAGDTRWVATQTTVANTQEADRPATSESASLFLLGGGLSLAGWAIKRLRQEFPSKSRYRGRPAQVMNRYS